MKQKEISLNIPQVNGFTIDEIGDEHVGTSAETPLREDAFEMEDDLKMEIN